MCGKEQVLEDKKSKGQLGARARRHIRRIQRLNLGRSRSKLKINREKEQAQTLVEFALILMSVLTIMMGIIEFGRLLQVWLTVQNSAEAGTRFAITGRYFVRPDTDPWDTARLQGIKDEARRVVGSLNVNDLAAPREPGYFNVTVRASDPPAGAQPGDEYPGGPNQRVTVLVVYNHELITPVVREIVPWIKVQARSEMITERYRHPGLGAPMGELPPVIPALIAGCVFTSDDDPISGVVMTGLPDPPTTDSNGCYIAEVNPGWFGTVRPQKASHIFEPTEREYSSVTSDMPSEDYLATSH
jgi:hypothetical protein